MKGYYSFQQDTKECYKRQRRTLHNDQRINPRRRYNNYKYICTHWVICMEIC